MTDDKIAEIRARHALSASWSTGYSDRATLLAEVDRLRAEIEQLRSELALMKSGFEIAYRAMGDKP